MPESDLIFLFQRTSSSLSVFLIIGSVLHSVSFFSSSFIEEEHQTWYFLLQTLNVVLLLRAISLNYVNKKEEKIQNMSDDSYSKQHITNDIPSQHESLLQRKPLKSQNLGIKKQETQIGVMHSGTSSESRRIQAVIACSVLLLLTRVARTWNQTGDKWSHLPDVGDWLLQYVYT